MSLQEKVGQLFMVDVFSNKNGKDVDKVRKLIADYHIGGIIFSKGGPQRQAKLNNEFQELSKTPLLIGMDAEWGLAMRLDSTFALPWNMTLGAIQDLKLIEEAGAAISRNSKRLGVHINFAPVVDINTNPLNPIIGNRSFGEEKINVTLKSVSFMRGMHKEGILSSAKHFPGHGDTKRDSHKTLPTISFSKSRLDSIELYPFKKAIEVGVDSIMTAHVYFPAIEKEDGIPATLSKSVLTDLLREELKFDGLIITDCMEMNAIVNTFGTVEGAVRTIEAGSDTVLVSHSYQRQKKAIEAVIEAVKSGRISEKRIDQSVKRILTLKAKRINLKQVDRADPAQIDFKNHQELAQKLAENALTLLKNEDIFPIKNVELVSENKKERCGKN
jgi:beta-glucosidase-like glycosyl hydrolase